MQLESSEYFNKETVYNWFPGHMKKTLEEIRGVIKKIDVVIEVRDARAPMTCVNPAFEKTFADKKKVILLHKASLANPKITREWQKYLKNSCESVLISDKKNFKISGQIIRHLKNIPIVKNEKFLKKGMRIPPIRVLVAGLPNTGKSTLINLLLRKKRTIIGDKPGVTRNLNWIALENKLLLLDSPGVFLSKPETKQAALKLAAIHCLRDERIDFIELANYLFQFLKVWQPTGFERLFTQESANSEVELWRKIDAKYLKLTRDGNLDGVQTCRNFIKDFRDGKLGAISLEFPPH